MNPRDFPGASYDAWKTRSDLDDTPDWDEPEDEYDPGEECGRWDNGRLRRSCALAGTEFCDFECPYRD